MPQTKGKPELLVMDRGTVVDTHRAQPGTELVIGKDVSAETAARMVRHGRGHYAEPKPPRQRRANAVDTAA